MYIHIPLQEAFVGCMLHNSRTPSSVCVIPYLVGYVSHISKTISSIH